MNHFESNYKEQDYKSYKDSDLTEAYIAGHLSDHLRNKSNLAKYSKAELVEILWNMEQLALAECDHSQLGYCLKEIQHRKEGR